MGYATCASDDGSTRSPRSQFESAQNLLLVKGSVQAQRRWRALKKWPFILNADTETTFPHACTRQSEDFLRIPSTLLAR